MGFYSRTSGWLLAGLCLCLLLGAVAASVPAADAPETMPLRSNGVVFTRDGETFPVHCLEASNLLAYSEAQQEALMDRAVQAGFNAVSFETILFGSGGLSEKLGTTRPEYLAKLAGTLQRLRAHLLYAFPVLWTARGAVQLERAVGGKSGSFWTLRRHQEWEYYLLAQLCSGRDDAGNRLLASPGIGGWVLYSGICPSSEGDFRAWTLFTIRCLRVLGLPQMAGLSLSPPWKYPRVEAAPAPLSPAAQAFPDPDALRDMLTRLPIPTGLDFFRVDLGQPVQAGQFSRLENWQAGGQIEVPVVLRADWSQMPAGQRAQLAGFGKLAGVSGSLPWEEFPGEEMWPAPPRRAKGAPRPVALAVSEFQAYLKNDRPVLHVLLNRPGTVKLAWNRAWPLSRTASSMDDALLHRLPLKGAKVGDRLLVRVYADSEKWGRALLRTTWVMVNREEKGVLDTDYTPQKARKIKKRREKERLLEEEQQKIQEKAEKEPEESPTEEPAPAPAPAPRKPAASTPVSVAAPPTPVPAARERVEAEPEELPLSAPPPPRKSKAGPGPEGFTSTAEPDVPEAEPVEMVPDSQVPTEK